MRRREYPRQRENTSALSSLLSSLFPPLSLMFHLFSTSHGGLVSPSPSLSLSLSLWLRSSSGGARRCRLSWAHFVKLNLSLFQEQLWGFEASLNAGLKKDHPVKMLKRFSTRAGWGE